MINFPAPPPAKKKISSRVIYHSPWMHLREDEIIDRDGLVSRFAVTERPSFVVGICLVGGTSIVLVRQFRYAVGSWQWELPQGGVESNESTEEAALRELREETGWRAGRPSVLVSGLQEAGDWATQRFSVVVAHGEHSEPARSIPGEAIDRSITVPLTDAAEMTAVGEIPDPPSICAIHLWIWHQSRRGRPENGVNT